MSLCVAVSDRPEALPPSPTIDHVLSEDRIEVVRLRFLEHHSRYFDVRQRRAREPPRNAAISNSVLFIEPYGTSGAESDSRLAVQADRLTCIPHQRQPFGNRTHLHRLIETGVIFLHQARGDRRSSRRAPSKLARVPRPVKYVVLSDGEPFSAFFRWGQSLS